MLAVSLLPAVASADCKAQRENDTVLCPRADFDDLVAEAIESRAEADRLQIMLADSRRDAAACADTQQRCRVDLAQASQPKVLPVIGYVVGAVGAVLLGTAPRDNWAVIGSGAALVATGLVMTLPF